MDERHYQTLSLPPVPSLQPVRKTGAFDVGELHAIIDELDCVQIQVRLRQTIDRLVTEWNERHNKLYDALKRNEQSQSQMHQTLNAQTDKYQKAVREIQFYRAQYERTIVAATARSTSQLSRHRTLEESESESDLTVITQSLHDEPIGERQGADNYDIESMLNIPDGPLPVPPTLSELNASVATSPTLDNLSFVEQTQSSPSSVSVAATVTTVSEDMLGAVTTAAPGAGTPSSVSTSSTVPARTAHSELRFACTEGFWDTIARGKSNKEEVDGLISKYLRNGGQPNVAKISATVKSVREGYSLLHALIAVKNTSALMRVIDAGADVNAMPLVPDESPDMVAPVVLAARIGYLNGIKALARFDDCDFLQARGANNESVLHAAVENDRAESDEHLKVVQYLMQATQGALLERVDVTGATPLHYACKAGRTRHVTLLLREFGARSDARDIRGETPLHYAVRYQRPKVLTCLIDLGVFPNPYEPKKVPTPLDMAKSIGLKNMADYITKAGGKTTKEMEKQQCRASTAGSVSSSNCSTVSGGTSSGESVLSSKSFFGSKSFRGKLDNFMP